MSIAKFIAYQHHHAPAGVQSTTDADPETGAEDDPAVFDALYDNPRLMLLLHDAARTGDLTALRDALIALHPAECDHAGPTVVVAELLVRMIMTASASSDERDRQLALITALHDHGLCHAQHFESVLMLAVLEHGATTGWLPAEVYDTAEKYIAEHDDADLADYLHDIERQRSREPGTQDET